MGGCAGQACEWLGMLADAEKQEQAPQEADETTAGASILPLVSVINCIQGSGGCGTAKFITTNSNTEFHNDELREMSRQIEALLAPVRERGSAAGLDLAFVNTRQGFLLAWANHPSEVPSGRTITIQNTAEEIAEALDLRDFDSGPAQAA